MGQIIPVIVSGAFVLLDGYLRVKALKACGRDTVMAEIWDCTEEEALVEVLARSHSRKWDVIEEAALFGSSMTVIISLKKDRRHGGAQAGLGLGRLALYNALSEEMMELIRKGAVSTWTATRVIVPIARAIPEHGLVLSENLSRNIPLHAGDGPILRYYQEAGRRQRENMVRDPVLFLKSARAREEILEAKALKEGPEGKWLKDFKVITHILTRLTREVPTLFYRGQPNLDRRILLTALDESRKRSWNSKKR